MLSKLKKYYNDYLKVLGCKDKLIFTNKNTGRWFKIISVNIFTNRVIYYQGNFGYKESYNGRQVRYRYGTIKSIIIHKINMEDK